MNGLTIVTPKLFNEAAHREMDNSPYLGFITFHDIDEITRSGLAYLANNGQTGMVVLFHEPTTAATLFNTSGIPGAGLQLFQYLVEKHNIKEIDAFEGILTDTYHNMGFQTYEVQPFNAEYAHDWDYERFGTPPVHYMSRVSTINPLQEELLVAA